MGRISRRHLDKALEARIFDIFWEHIASVSSPALVKEFLQSLLSHTELVMLSKRLAIAILLSRGFTYDRIDETLKVSKATIATVHRQLTTGAPGYTKAIKLASVKREKEALWDSLEKMLLKLSLPARYGSVKYVIKSEIGKGLRKREYQRSNL